VKARGAISATLASAGILLAGWQAGAHVAETGSTVTTSVPTAAGALGAAGAASGTTGSSGSAAASATPGQSAASGATGASAAAAAASKTYAGSVVQTRFGPVQVQITVKAGAITDVSALQLTNDSGRSVQISNRAAPLLRTEVLAAQSAKIKTISGATVTSGAYVTSLQAAIDAAHL